MRVRLPKDYKYKEGDKVKLSYLYYYEGRYTWNSNKCKKDLEKWERVKRYQGAECVVARDQDEDDMVLVEVDKVRINDHYGPVDEEGYSIPVVLGECESPTELIAVHVECIEMWDLEKALKQMTDREVLGELNDHRRHCSNVRLQNRCPDMDFSPCPDMELIKKELETRPHIPRGRKGRLYKIEQGKKQRKGGRKDK